MSIFVTMSDVPHNEQRYDTVGDWQTPTLSGKDDGLVITVSRMPDWRYEYLVGIHELIEAVLCRHAGVTQEQVDKFDMAMAPWNKEMEVGDHPASPYRRQHFVATTIERILASELGVDWVEYDHYLESL